MIVIPAIDVRAGRAVRLLRGDPNEETAYDDDPVQVAVRFQVEGARRLHVIDLDAALDEGSNRDTIREICRSVVLPVQVGGGVRTLEDVAAVLEIGGGRAILGTSAALDPGFVGGHAMVKGWREEGPPIEEVIPALDDAGTPRYLVTAIARDGTLDGPDLRLYRHVLGLTDRPIIASGGVRSADDIWALRDAGCEAAVTGKALYEKTLKLSQVTRG